MLVVHRCGAVHTVGRDQAGIAPATPTLARMLADLRALADRQGGCFTRRQALLDHHEASLRRWTGRGLIEPIGPGVFAIVPVPTTPAARLRRAEVLVGARLIGCGSTAATWHGFTLQSDNRLHVTTFDGRSAHPPPGVVLYQQIPRSNPVQVDGCWVTCRADTAVDVAIAASPMDRLACLDAAAAAGVPVADMVAAVQLSAGRRGIVDIRRLVPFTSPLSESPMESRVRQRILDDGCPPPEVQVVVALPDGTRRIDLAYRERRIGIEYDGQDFHSGDGSLRRDRERHNALVAASWTMIYATAADVYVNPDRFLSLLQAQLLFRPVVDPDLLPIVAVDPTPVPRQNDHADPSGVSPRHAVAMPELPGLSA